MILTESVAFKAQLYTVYIIYMIKIWGALSAKGMGQAVKLKWFSELLWGSWSARLAWVLLAHYANKTTLATRKASFALPIWPRVTLKHSAVKEPLKFKSLEKKRIKIM